MLKSKKSLKLPQWLDFLLKIQKVLQLIYKYIRMINQHRLTSLRVLVADKK
jgi:hypothetical protein